MNAMRLHKYMPAEELPLTFETLPDPQPGPGQIRVRVDYCGVRHTYLHTVEGDIHPPELPIIPGHQVVGRVSERGGQVKNLRVGDRVGVAWIYSACEACSLTDT